MCYELIDRVGDGRTFYKKIIYINTGNKYKNI